MSEESFSEALCPCLVCTPRTLGLERASFLQLLRQQAVPRAQGRQREAGMGTAQDFHSFRVQESWAGSVLSPKGTILGVGRKTFFNPSKCIAPHNYFIIRIIAKETQEPSFPWCLAPLEAGTEGARSSRPCISLGHNPFLRGSLSFSPSLPLCVLQLQHKLFAREVSLYDPIQHTQEKTVGDRPNVLTNLS